jgi:hypothetical protein
LMGWCKFLLQNKVMVAAKVCYGELIMLSEETTQIQKGASSTRACGK